MASAVPGDVIAIAGVIRLTRTLVVRTPEVTLSCALPGAGLSGGRGQAFDLVSVLARNIAIRGLVFEASTFGMVLRAQRTLGAGESAQTSHVQFQGNIARCGSGCVFIIGLKHAVISDNYFEVGSGAGTGIHMQAFFNHTPDSARIERNVIVATQPTGSVLYGAIRPRDARDVVVRDNDISGPWSNGITVAELHASVIERNTVTGAQRHGLWLTANPFTPISVTRLLIRGNALSSAGHSVVFVDRACSNVFVGNRLASLSGGAKVFFTSATGNNVLVGETSASVDNGVQDCDGDGAADPNFLSGSSRTASEPGTVIGQVMQHTSELR